MRSTCPTAAFICFRFLCFRRPLVADSMFITRLRHPGLRFAVAAAAPPPPPPGEVVVGGGGWMCDGGGGGMLVGRRHRAAAAAAKKSCTVCVTRMLPCTKLENGFIFSIKTGGLSVLHNGWCFETAFGSSCSLWQVDCCWQPELPEAIKKVSSFVGLSFNVFSVSLAWSTRKEAPH